MKPSKAFLRKVASGDVQRIRGYTSKRGGYERIIGGEASLKKHCDAGFVKWPAVPSLGRPTTAELTDLGREALEQ